MINTTENETQQLKSELAYVKRQNLLLRKLAKNISPWLYSIGSPPAELNEEFLRVVDRGEDV